MLLPPGGLSRGGRGGQVALQLWLPPSFLVDAFSVAAQVRPTPGEMPAYSLSLHRHRQRSVSEQWLTWS